MLGDDAVLDAFAVVEVVSLAHREDDAVSAAVKANICTLFMIFLSFWFSKHLKFL
jgi:hypothetical protein